MAKDEIEANFFQAPLSTFIQKNHQCRWLSTLLLNEERAAAATSAASEMWRNEMFAPETIQITAVII